MRYCLLAILVLFCSDSWTQDVPVIVRQNDARVFELHVYDEAGLPLGTGTGFFSNADGTAVSNWHVLEGASFAYALLANDVLLPVSSILRTAKEVDLVEFQVELGEETVTAVEIDTALPEKGESLVIIGCPENYRNSVSVGVVASLSDIDGEVMIQTEASISPGSSGSPVFNENGEVVGVATQTNERGQNLNFCVPISRLQELELVREEDQLTSVTTPIHVFHLRCAYENSLVLHSIAFHEQRTVAHMSFANLSLQWGDNAFIYCSVGDPETSFQLRDDRGNSVSAVLTSIGESAEDNSTLRLGETRQFTVQFPPIRPSDVMDLQEGESGDWKFLGLEMSSSKGMHLGSLSDITEVANLWALMLSAEDLQYVDDGSEFVYLESVVEDMDESPFSLNLGGVVAYLFGDEGRATRMFQRAAGLAPSDAMTWYNLYAITPDDDADQEIYYLDKAIVADPDMPELKQSRGLVHYGRGDWRGCYEDLSVWIGSGRDYSTVDMAMFGHSQVRLGDIENGCTNIRSAFDAEYEPGAENGWAEWIANILVSECPKKFHK